MTRFEYRVLTLHLKGPFTDPGWFSGQAEVGPNSALEEILNALGAEGWEVISHAKHSGPQDSQIILRRQRLE